MTILILADHLNGNLAPSAERLVTAAGQMGGDIHILVAGSGAEASGAAAQASSIAGVGKVLLANDGDAFGAGLAEPLASLLVHVAPGYDGVVAAASSQGRDVLPRAAALLDTMVVSDVVAVIDPQTFRRPIHAGNASQVVRSNGLRMLTVRASAFAAAPQGEAAPVETVNVTISPGRARQVDVQTSGGGRPDLTAARVVVAGGRGFGSKANFEALLLPLADALDAGVGASRAAVDAGYAPNDWQVGQTGKNVAPELYLACGISGAIQHIAGMKSSKVVVAINKDADAPIFKVADYGLVADLQAVVPALAEAITRRKAG